MDSVIVQWAMEARSGEVVQCVHQRDCFAAAMSEGVRRASYLARECETFVGPKMTAVLQLTDTDAAFVLNSAARFEVEIKQQTFCVMGGDEGTV